MGDYTGSAASNGPQHDIGDWKKIKRKKVKCFSLTRLVQLIHQI
jgi:hypothetical protein